MCHAHASGMTIGPGPLDECLARAAVARLGDATLAPRLAGRAFLWHQAEQLQQLARMIKASQLARLRHHRHGGHESHPAHRLECLHHRRHHPVGHDLDQRRLQAIKALDGCLHRVQHFVKCRPLRRVGKVLPIEPTLVSAAPTRLAFVAASMPEQEGGDVLG